LSGDRILEHVLGIDPASQPTFSLEAGLHDSLELLGRVLDQPISRRRVTGAQLGEQEGGSRFDGHRIPAR
jgi:hypothetical protein